PAIASSAPLGRALAVDLELVRLTASSLPRKICPTRLSGEFRACCLTIVGGAVMRERFDAAGAGRHCAPAALIRRGRPAPQLHRWSACAVLGTRRHRQVMKARLSEGCV